MIPISRCSLTKTAILCCLLLFNYAAYAQSISGKISGSKNMPVDRALVRLFKDTAKISSAITDSTGAYRLEKLSKGAFRLQVSSMGFKEINLSILLSSDTTINIELLSYIENLHEVEIISRKPIIEQKADRVIFNVENSVAAIGSDALEAIAKAPRVKVVNDNISIIGKSNIKIMINNKLSPLSGSNLVSYLKTISADNIAKIEVITNPPAQYDAEGNSGLINIVLKKNKNEGYKGSVMFGYRKSTQSFFSGNTDFNYKKDKSNFNINMSGGKGSSTIVDQASIYYPAQTWITSNNRREYSRNFSFSANWDYELTKNDVLGASYSTGTTRPDRNENIQTSIANISKKIDSTIQTNALTDGKTRFNTANLNYVHTFDTLGKKITLEGNWFTYSDNSSRPFSNTTYSGDGTIIQNSFSNFLSNSKQDVNFYTLNAAVDLPYKTFTIAFGGKLSFIKNSSDIEFYKSINGTYQLDNANTNKFKYSDNIQAVYANINKAFNKRWELQVGLRGENTISDGVSLTETNKNTYFKVFPTAYLAFKMNEKNSFTINYGRRINRPGLFSLNPFKWYTSPYAYSEGNPFLKPSFNNNFELSHLYDNFLSTAISFSKETDSYEQLTMVNPDNNIQVTKPLNFLTGYSYQFSNNISFTRLKWLESNNQILVYYRKSTTKLPEISPTTEGFGAYVSTDNQIIFNKERTVIGGINYYYEFPEVSGIDHVKSTQSLSLSLKVLCMDKKLQLAFNAADVFKTAASRFSSTVNGIKQSYYNYYDYRRFRMSIKYSFGNNDIKNRNRDNSSNDERNRVN